ncbi:MAG: hypothetical protein PHC88_17050, partial [Terrimicrobiaceae bacterium]|nr:hypothetical protein [Terrimicrobiaceae bacterium]
GQGTFVARGLKRASPAERRRQLEPALRQLVAEALHLGLDEEELTELTSRTFHAMQKNPKRP